MPHPYEPVAGLEGFGVHNGRALLPVEFDHDDHAVPLQIVHFDFTSMDTIADEAEEALARGAAEFQKFIAALRRTIEDDIKLSTVTQLDGFASQFRNRYMGYDLLRDACGLCDLEGETGVTLSKKWGLSKEAWQQDRERMRALLGLRKTRTMRDAKARQNMRLRNFRRAE